MKRYLSLSPSGKVEDDNSLFSGVWICWGTLTQAEQFICLCIILTPLWWIVGWTYTLLLIVVSIVTYELWQSGRLSLPCPSLIAISAIVFNLYKSVSAIIHSEVVPLSSYLSLIVGICFGLLIWYIESKDIAVRTEVIAWALSVLVVEMLLFWVVFHFVFKEPHYNPPRVLVAQLTDKGEKFIPGSGSSNYLLPYWPDDKLLGGLVRFSFFFPTPEDLALLIGFICLIALDIKKRLWSTLLFLAGLFLLLLSGTRSNWLIFPLVLILRYLFVIRKVWGPWLVYTLIAVFSFVAFSLPPVTDFISNTYANTKEATGNLRQNSTEARAKIYERTLNAIISEPENLLLGRGVAGETVVPGYEPAKVGTHSFILGALLYRSGLLGTSIYVVFWTSLSLRLYRTRSTRPACSLLMLFYLSLAFLTMEVSMTTYLLILIYATRDKCEKRLARGMSYA